MKYIGGKFASFYSARKGKHDDGKDDDEFFSSLPREKGLETKERFTSASRSFEYKAFSRRSKSIAQFFSSSSSDETTTGKSNTNDQRRRVLFLGMTTVVLLSAEKAKAFTVGGENLPSGSTFPSSNEKFFNDEDEEEERYTTKDLVLDFVSPIVALRVVNIAFNGGMGGSPKWLDYLCVASVGVVLWVFATDYSGLDAALH